MSEVDDELFLMTNLYPATTGLPTVIWVGPSYGAPHDVRIKVMQHHGTRMDPGDLAVVAVRPAPHLVAGHLSPADLGAVVQWLALNQPAILDHWNGLTDSVQMGRQLQPLSPPIPPRAKDYPPSMPYRGLKGCGTASSRRVRLNNEFSGN